MAVQLFKPNPQILKEQATRAQEAEKNRKEKNDFKWGELKEGINILRVLPSTDSRGTVGKMVSKHFFNNSPFAGQLKPLQCLKAMYAGREGVVCPIHDVGDKLLAQWPQLNLDGWLKRGEDWYIQAVDRQDPEMRERSQLYRFTPTLRNWLVLEMDALMDKGIDLTDLQKGFDIKITKTTEKYYKNGKERKNTKYEKTLWGLEGPTPLDPDPAIAQKIIESMQDPDKIWKYPDDAGLMAINKASSDIYSHYQKMAYSQEGAQVQVPGVVAPSTVAPVAPVAEPVTAPVAAPAVVAAVPAAAVPVVAPVAEPVAAPVAAAPVAEPAVAVAAAVAAAPVAAAAIAAAPTGAVAPNQPAESPTDRPACFGGANPRETHPKFAEAADDGGTGYSEDSELCLTCKYEMACMDSSANL